MNKPLRYTLFGLVILSLSNHAALASPINFNLVATSGLTDNQANVAYNLDKARPIPVIVTPGFIKQFIPPTTDIQSIVIKIGAAPTAQDKAEDLSELSPQKFQMSSVIAFNNFGFNAAQLDNHTASLRYGQGGFDASGLQAMDSSMPGMLGQIKGRLLAWSTTPSSNLMSDVADPVVSGVKMTDDKELAVPVTDKNRWSAFIDGNVVLADIDSTSDVPHSSYTTGGVTAGADYRLDEHWAVGGLFGFGHTDAQLDNDGSRIRVDSYSPGVYATYADQGWFANGLFAYNYNTYQQNRAIAFLGRNAHSSPDGNQYSADLDGGYEFHSGAWTFGPTAALQYVHLDVNSFTESGAGAADLNVSGQEVDSLRSRFGGEVRYKAMWYGGKVTATPHLSVSWQHEYLDSSRGISAQFDGQGLGSFSVNTTSLDRDSALIDVGLETQWNSAFNLFVDYQAQAGQSDFFAQSVTGGAKVDF